MATRDSIARRDRRPDRSFNVPDLGNRYVGRGDVARPGVVTDLAEGFVTHVRVAPAALAPGPPSPAAYRDRDPDSGPAPGRRPGQLFDPDDGRTQDLVVGRPAMTFSRPINSASVMRLAPCRGQVIRPPIR
jgi:hypothetical protein